MATAWRRSAMYGGSCRIAFVRASGGALLSIDRSLKRPKLAISQSSTELDFFPVKSTCEGVPTAKRLGDAWAVRADERPRARSHPISVKPLTSVTLPRHPATLQRHPVRRANHPPSSSTLTSGL
jgi:hypothetical protein